MNREFPMWISASRRVPSSCPGHKKFPARAGRPPEFRRLNLAVTETHLLPHNHLFGHCCDPPPLAPNCATAIGGRHRAQKQHLGHPVCFCNENKTSEMASFGRRARGENKPVRDASARSKGVPPYLMASALLKRHAKFARRKGPFFCLPTRIFRLPSLRPEFAS